MAKLIFNNQQTHKYRKMPIYGVWHNMVVRCETPSATGYEYYGGRGIKVCNEWRMNPDIFCEWAINNGYKKGLCLDRIDNDGDYCPNNCQFITHKENCNRGKRRLRKDNKSGYSGITIPKYGKYVCHLHIDGKRTYLGTRKTLELAIELMEQNIQT